MRDLKGNSQGFYLKLLLPLGFLLTDACCLHRFAGEPGILIVQQDSSHENDRDTKYR